MAPTWETKRTPKVQSPNSDNSPKIIEKGEKNSLKCV